MGATPLAVRLTEAKAPVDEAAVREVVQSPILSCQSSAVGWGALASAGADLPERQERPAAGSTPRRPRNVCRCRSALACAPLREKEE